MRRPAVLLTLIAAAAAAAGCGDNTPGNITIETPTTFAAPLREFTLRTPDAGLAVEETDTTTLPTADTDGYQLVIVDDPAIAAESFRIDPIAATTRGFAIHTHDILGAQYGVAAALEHFGFRFRHPYDTFIPFAPTPDTTDHVLGTVHTPDVRVRGFQFHTLHPIEPYFAFWDPQSAGDVDDFKRIVDWTIKNRGNFIQWVALDDIEDPTRHAAWQTATRAMLDYAHARGVRVGLNVELFSTSNLQLAFDLVDSQTDPIAGQIAARLPLIIDGLPFDVYAVSFGEFFDADPQAFIDALNEVTTQFHTLAPAAEIHAVVHLGATQRVDFMGQNLPYYFLVKFADPSIVPDIHTVMYFNLFEDTAGAYGYTSFDEHRQYLVDRMCASQPVAYFPEDAYWVAFDDSVPTFLPVYVRSRVFDLQKLRSDAAPPPCAPLDEQLLFSSGWEWGYWMNDVAALRASYELPATSQDAIAEQLAPDLGSDAAALVSQLADAQHDALIDDELAPYLAARDGLIEAARSIDVVSQPDRTTFDDLVAADDATRTAFTTNVLVPLAAHGDAVDALTRKLDALALPDTRWTREIRDGFAIDRARTRFVVAAYQTTLAHLAGDDAAVTAHRAEAQAAFDDATTIVDRRGADLHDRHGTRLSVRGPNATTYQFGYLFFGATLCYWTRELDQIDGILGEASLIPPACIL